MTNTEMTSTDQFGDYINSMWAEAGCPSSRTVSQEVTRKTGRSMSHTTFNDVRRGKRVPSWAVAEAITLALGGDVEQTRQVWVETRAPRVSDRVTLTMLAEQMSEVVTQLKELTVAVEGLRRSVELPELRVDVRPEGFNPVQELGAGVDVGEDYYDKGGVTQWP